MKSNFHTHTFRCCHAGGTEEDYTKSAIDNGLGVLGFSDHAPFPDFDYGLRMGYEDLPVYLEAIDKAQEKYKGQIQLYKGLEIEYHKQYLSYYADLLGKWGLDYLALGEHIFEDDNGKQHNIFSAESTEVFVSYAKAVCEAIETGYFKFVAHPDIMFINNFDWDENCQRACEMIVECADKHKMILEFNANGIRRGAKPYPDGVRYPYPHKRFWELVNQTDISVIVGADCHIPEQVRDRAVEESEKIIKNENLNFLDTLF